VAVITETHLKRKHALGTETINGYELFRRDREGRRGGGVAIYVSTKLISSRCDISDQNSNFELLWIKITTVIGTIIIGGVYHPPKPMYSTDTFLDYLENCVDKLHDQCTLLILAGDFNSLDSSDITSRTGLGNIVKLPTRGPSHLDYIFTSYDCYDNIKVIKPLVNTDHSAVVAYNGPVITSQYKQKTRVIFRKRNPELNANYLNHCSNLPQTFFIPELTPSIDPQCVYDHFYAAVHSLMDHHYPERTVTVTSADPHFITPEIKSTLRRKNRLMHAGKIEQANALASKVGTMITKANSKLLADINPKDSSATLWSRIKQITNKSTSHKTPDGVTAAVLNSHYAAISTDASYRPPLTKSNLLVDDDRPVDEIKIFHMLERLKVTATGLDGIPAWFLKLSAPILALPLSTFINLSITSCTVPQQWKSAIIHPIPKIAHPQKAVDYRPISITSILSRLTERVIVSTYIYPAILNPPSSLNFSDQFAFRPTGSTTAALIFMQSKIIAMLADQPYVRVIALDFSKAFDTIRHSELFRKLSSLQIPDNIYNWLVDFFTARQHCCKFDDVTSPMHTISASVIQGSVLGPVCYAVTAADLSTRNPDNVLVKFADDTYLLVPANQSETVNDELDHIKVWAVKNNLNLNASKSYEIIVHHPRTRLSRLTVPPPLQNIARVVELKSLGVTLTENFSPSQHITEVVNSASQSLYALRQLKAHGLPASLISRMFNTLVLSKLTYASPAWWGFTSSQDRDRLESFIRRAQKSGFCKSCITFHETCETADARLFKSITTNSNHMLAQLLPPLLSRRQGLRNRPHLYTLPSKRTLLDKSSFITKMIYKPFR